MPDFLFALLASESAIFSGHFWVFRNVKEYIFCLYGIFVVFVVFRVWVGWFLAVLVVFGIKSRRF